eukprot:1154236-Pelagomonas_calceolata.AAC.18
MCVCDSAQVLHMDTMHICSQQPVGMLNELLWHPPLARTYRVRDLLLPHHSGRLWHASGARTYLGLHLLMRHHCGQLWCASGARQWLLLAAHPLASVAHSCREPRSEGQVLGGDKAARKREGKTLEQPQAHEKALRLLTGSWKAWKPLAGSVTFTLCTQSLPGPTGTAIEEAWKPKTGLIESI